MRLRDLIDSSSKVVRHFNNQSNMNKHGILHLLGTLIAFSVNGQTNQAAITIQADQKLHSVSRYLSGACLEDVNHEVYGGLYSQMIFGESFAEPAPQLPLKGFSVFGGKWTLEDGGSVRAVGSDGAKIVWDGPGFSEGETSVDLWLTETGAGNGGLILKVSDAGNGADVFYGYEISLERPGTLVIGRHRNNWEPLRRVPCGVPVNQWITLTVRLTAKSLEVLVNGKSITQYEDTEHSLVTGTVGLRTWQHDVRFRNFSVTTGGVQHKIPFELGATNGPNDAVSSTWRAVRRGSAEGELSIQEKDAFSGRQSQQITFTRGTGEIGVENQSLNHWGMNFVKARPYEGCLWARTESPAQVFVALESRAGAVLAEKSLELQAGGWQRLDFTLKPDAADTAGQFAIKLRQPGTVNLGYAFLQPGTWGRFKGLPVRKDVAEGLVNQGVTVLRYGGSMVNAPEYRWKKMIGPRDRRQPYAGNWYPYSSNGWGIPDFLNFCDAAGFLAIPDFNINESPKDMADFVEYANGSTNSIWGRQRMADGHPQSYGLKYLELGNEERVDETYFQKFQALAQAIWAADTNLTLVVGDFAYTQIIRDPFNFTGADSGITTLAAQQKILTLARRHNREVWFDVHVWTGGPRPESSLAGMFSYDDALKQIADGAAYKVVVFELNANNHSQRRALANALAINAVERDGRLPVVTSANCLQPDGQNDNGWDQGLLFLNPAQVWLQPPGFVTRMYSANYQRQEVRSTVADPGNDLDVSAQLSPDGKTLVLKVVNLSERVTSAAIAVRGYSPAHLVANVEELEGALDSMNTATIPHQVKPFQKSWRPHFENGRTQYAFPPNSITAIRFD